MSDFYDVILKIWRHNDVTSYFLTSIESLHTNYHSCQVLSFLLIIKGLLLGGAVSPWIPGQFPGITLKNSPWQIEVNFYFKYSKRKKWWNSCENLKSIWLFIRKLWTLLYIYLNGADIAKFAKSWNDVTIENWNPHILGTEQAFDLRFFLLFIIFENLSMYNIFKKDFFSVYFPFNYLNPLIFTHDKRAINYTLHLTTLCPNGAFFRDYFSLYGRSDRFS